MFVLKDGGPAAVFACGDQLLRVGFVSPGCVRITYTQGRDFQDRPSRVVVGDRACIRHRMTEQEERFTLATDALSVAVDKRSGALSYWTRDGSLLTREPCTGGKWLTPKELYRNVFASDFAIAATAGPDGARAAAVTYESIFDRMVFEAKLEFCFAEDEALFGLGSHEEGYGNLRGRSRELYQQNLKAVVPCLVSTRGYAVLMDCCSLMTFHDDAHGSYWWADAVEELDFYLISGGSFEEVTRKIHELTGPAPMLPKWAFGYLQSKERYVNARELLEVVSEYRRRRVPLDGIILDWKSWPKGEGWGQKALDPERFPDPEGMTAELHALGARLMVSIWPIMTGGCTDQMEMLERNLMLGNQSTYNAFLPDARAAYWKQTERGLFSKGVDAWWCDCTEPFEADWCGAMKPEPHARLTANVSEAKKYLDATEINAYSLVHAQGIYDGQRSVTHGKRVLNLTRSSCAGQHRYGSVTWNGDICATWETLRRCIAEGVHFCATGEPYWTVDIGGFFIGRDPKLWFWRGDYADGCRGLTAADAVDPNPNDTGCRDLGYWELYTRWLQYGAFLPLFRSHGTDAAREIWRFGEEGNRFYDTIARFIRLRYELMPYIYSLAADVTLRGAPMMRALALEFPSDSETHAITDEYLFGASLLVCPVTRPMYFEAGSRALRLECTARSVYLPAGRRWFDFWTGSLHDGGQSICANAPLEIIPLYVRSGSILPMTETMQFVDERLDAPYAIRVFTGDDAAFSLYEDEGDGYGYEKGGFARVPMRWSEERRRLTIGERQGEFPALVKERDYRILFVLPEGQRTQTIRYSGEEIHVDL